MKGRPLGPSAPARERLAKLRDEFEGSWDAQDRAWLEMRDTCVCTSSVPGSSYLRVRRCARCGHIIKDAR
jgi:hypothetical protein